MTNEEFFDMFLNAVKTAYISVYGVEAWNSLSDKEKHDVTMTLANGLATLATNDAIAD